MLDGVQVWAVRRQEQQSGTRFGDGLPDGISLVTAEIVQDDNVAVPQGRDEELLDVEQKAFTVDRAIKDAWGGDAINAQCRQKGQRQPVAMRRAGAKSPALLRPAAQGRHVGLDPGLIDKNQPRCAQPGLQPEPPFPLSGDIRPGDFLGVNGFF